MDKWGNAVGITSTVNTYFGSKVISPSTGTTQTYVHTYIHKFTHTHHTHTLTHIHTHHTHTYTHTHTHIHIHMHTHIKIRMMMCTDLRLCCDKITQTSETSTNVFLHNIIILTRYLIKTLCNITHKNKTLYFSFK